MTETEVNDLEVEVAGATILDRNAEKEWSQTQLESLRQEEQQTIYSFRMFKAIRDDQRMQTAAKTLKDIRGCMEHLTTRLKYLG